MDTKLFNKLHEEYMKSFKENSESETRQDFQNALFLLRDEGILKPTKEQILNKMKEFKVFKNDTR